VGEVGGAGAGAAGTWRRTVSCAEVVLAAGAVETARLLLASAHPGEPHGLGNDRDQVGRHLQGHLYGGATAVFDDHDPDEVVDLLGPGPAVATCDLRHGNPGVVGGGMLANEFVPTPAHAFRWLADGGFVPPHGPGAAAGVRALARRLVRVVGPVQEVTGADSRVRLDPRATDRHGDAVAMLSGGVHAEDRRGQEFLSAQAERWLRAAGASRVHRVPPLPASAGSAGPSGGQHQAGTCRMGTDPARSVVDPFGRLWGHEEVRVVDASVHVTNGGVNPVLTVHALALRTVEHLVTGRTRRRVSARA
ncbi:GMC family oxidoreductase, partial [Kineococcus sp. T13]|uniref:GMC oxidoreductase n=1 Tax=Kineococcus vitellinus TaxID=2696565 RepID=UPI00141319E8